MAGVGTVLGVAGQRPHSRVRSARVPGRQASASSARCSAVSGWVRSRRPGSRTVRAVASHGAGAGRCREGGEPGEFGVRGIEKVLIGERGALVLGDVGEGRDSLGDHVGPQGAEAAQREVRLPDQRPVEPVGEQPGEVGGQRGDPLLGQLRGPPDPGQADGVLHQQDLAEPDVTAHGDRTVGTVAVQVDEPRLGEGRAQVGDPAQGESGPFDDRPPAEALSQQFEEGRVVRGGVPAWPGRDQGAELVEQGVRIAR